MLGNLLFEHFVMNPYKQFFLISALVIAVFSHSTHAKEPANIQSVKEQLIKYHEQGEYHKDLTATVSEARKYLALRITENNQKSNKQKLAIVFDIDETVLSNFPFIKSHSFGGTIKEFDQNINAQNLAPIKPVRELYKFAKQNKVAIFFVTGRRETQRLATRTNLKNAGYNHWQQLYLKPNNYKEHSAIPFKSGIRKKIETKGYTIVESIGDQHSDLQGGYAEKTYKLPNPYYYIP